MRIYSNRQGIIIIFKLNEMEYDLIATTTASVRKSQEPSALLRRLPFNFFAGVRKWEVHLKPQQ